ncbi:MAG: sigma 54-interacting transcriptional regulator [Candidatus Adiutrix sp.]|jgi:DNA-binding NtrC family response regulator|nr:sigma 54-interacting transcriptional regulator [Candidatus Adiutrix sp.]
MAEIHAFQEDRLGFHFKLGPKAVLGRAPECDLILFDRSASRHHAEIFMVDEKYFIADLGSTNGTLVNERPINMQTRLEPFDSIKIGQELFIFEPGLSVVVGPAPSALIIEDLAEDAAGLVAFPAEEAARGIDPEDVPDLMALAHRLGSEKELAAIRQLTLNYFQERFGLTFMSILWPSRPPACRLISLSTSHDDKRLLLSRTPYLRAIQNREAVLWPRSISELSFNNGRRQVEQVDSPSLVGPLYAQNGQTGLMYLENLNRDFTEKDLKSFAAFLGFIGSIIGRHFDDYGRYGPNPLENSDAPDIILSSSDDQVKIVFSTAAQGASGSKPILISGESGTGKSALARYIHKVSPRKTGRFVTVNLAHLPPADIEPALFGQLPTETEPGRIGLVELADGGTLFLRHIEFLPPVAQKLLLMALEEGLFAILGAPRPQAVDLRVVSSTSIDLWSRVESGYFREDLYSRLNRLNISLPPLRDIRNDMEKFLSSFMSSAARDMGLTFTGIDPGALECLRTYNWPGNVAELKKEANLLVLFSRNGRVALEDLPVHLRLSPDAFLNDINDQPPPLVREAERHQLIGAMARSGGDLEKTAEMLQQRPEHIILKMRALGLDPINYQPPMSQTVPKGPGQTSVPLY